MPHDSALILWLIWGCWVCIVSVLHHLSSLQEKRTMEQCCCYNELSSLPKTAHFYYDLDIRRVFFNPCLLLMLLYDLFFRQSGHKNWQIWWISRNDTNRFTTLFVCVEWTFSATYRYSQSLNASLWGWRLPTVLVCGFNHHQYKCC